jgi:putative ATP-dependent endonuclease of OLD family
VIKVHLKSVLIRNFRGLRDVEVPLDKTTVLIGENNSGKSSFLDAVRLCLARGGRRSSPFDEYDYYTNENTSNPKDTEGIHIQFLFQEDQPDEWSEALIRSLGELAQPIPWETDPEEAVYTVSVNVTSKYEEARNDFFLSIEFLNPEGEALPPKNQTNTSWSNFIQQTPIFYLSALRDIKDTFGPRSQFWGSFLKNINIPQDKVVEIQDSLQNLNEDIFTNDERLEELKNTLENIQEVIALGVGETVSIQALPVRIWDLLSKSQIVLKGRGGNVSFPLQRHGQGTQSLAVVFLFQAYIDVLLKSAYSNTSKAILALEEPEAHLHPQAVRALSDQVQGIDCQKIITTHSPYFFQNLDLLNIRVFKKNGSETTVHFLREYATTMVSTHHALERFVESKEGKFLYNSRSSEFRTFSPLNEHELRALEGMNQNTEFYDNLRDFYTSSQLVIDKDERNDLYTFAQRTRGELFFARGWLLVEGQTEYIVLSYFSDVLNIPLDTHGVTIIDFQNNGSPVAFVKLAKSLSFSWKLLSDSDNQLESTLSQVKKTGYTEEEIRNLVKILPWIDFETFLAKEGFIEEYKAILGNKVREVTVPPNDEEYSVQIADLIKKDKVGNALKFVDYLKKHDFDNRRIPDLLKQLISECVGEANAI